MVTIMMDSSYEIKPNFKFENFLKDNHALLSWKWRRLSLQFEINLSTEFYFLLCLVGLKIINKSIKII